MNSEDNELEDDLSKVGSDAPSSVDESLNLSDLAKRLDDIENKHLALNQASGRIDSVKKYLDHQRTESNILSWIRIATLVVLLCIMGIISYVLYKQLITPSSFFKQAAPQVQITIIISFFGSIFLIASTVLKGTFQALGDRHKEDLLPPHIKEMIDMLKKAASGN